MAKGVDGLKIGIPAEYTDGMDPAITALWEAGQARLKQAGAELGADFLPHTKYALPTYYIIAPAEASSNLARYDGVRYGARAVANGFLMRWRSDTCSRDLVMRCNGGL